MSPISTPRRWPGRASATPRCGWSPRCNCSPRWRHTARACWGAPAPSTRAAAPDARCHATRADVPGSGGRCLRPHPRPTLAGLRAGSDSASERWAAGDAYSGRVQRALLGRIAVDEIMIIDDGLATLGLLEALVADEPTALVRPRTNPGTARRALGTACWFRLRALARAGRLLVFTGLPVPQTPRKSSGPSAGTLKATASNGWTPNPSASPSANPRWWSAPRWPPTDDPRRTVFPLAAGADRRGPVAYFPHRREPRESSLLAAHDGIVGSTNTPSPLKCGCARCAADRSSAPCPQPRCRPCACCSGPAASGSWARTCLPLGGNPSASPALRAHLSSSLELLPS